MQRAANSRLTKKYTIELPGDGEGSGGGASGPVTVYSDINKMGAQSSQLRPTMSQEELNKLEQEALNIVAGRVE